jgi:hypothetical protein
VIAEWGNCRVWTPRLVAKFFRSRSRLELIAMSALSVYANILADATAMEEDAMFHSFWDSKK